MELPRLDPRDYLWAPIIDNNSCMYYYSRYKNSIIKYNMDTKTYKTYLLSVLNSTFHPFLQKLTILDDCHLLLLFGGNYFKNEEECLFDFNICNGKIEMPYNFGNSGFPSKYNTDTIYNKNYGSGQYNFHNDYRATRNYCKFDSSVLIAAQGSNKPYDGVNFMDKSSILKVFRNQQPKYLKISANNVFSGFENYSKDGSMGEYYYYDIDYEFDNDTTLIMSYPFTHNIIKYNLVNNTFKAINTNPYFIETKSRFFPDSGSNYKDYFAYGSIKLTYIKNKKHYLRKIKFPTPDSIYHNSTFPDSWVELLLDSEFNAIGIQSPKSIIEKRRLIKTYYKNDLFGLSKTTDSTFLLNKYQINKFQNKNTIYKYPYPNTKVMHVRDYLFKINPDLLKQDTIPVVFIHGVCQSCVAKAALFLRYSQFPIKNNPFVIVFPNISSGKLFFNENHINIDSVSNLNIDSSSSIYNYLSDLDKFGILVKSKNHYTFKSYSFNELSEFFHFINTSVKIDKVCLPIKEY